MYPFAVFGKEVQQSHSPSRHADIYGWKCPLRWNCHVRSCSCSQSRWENYWHVKTFVGRSSRNNNHVFSYSCEILSFVCLDLACGFWSLFQAPVDEIGKSRLIYHSRLILSVDMLVLFHFSHWPGLVDCSDYMRGGLHFLHDSGRFLLYLPLSFKEYWIRSIFLVRS